MMNREKQNTPRIINKTEVIPGEIYAIPLFLPTEDIKENLKNYKKVEFENRGRAFVFYRIIEDKGGSGIFVEVFPFTTMES